jgi:hypothetical protein
LYKTKENIISNADVNGAFNIIKKVTPDLLFQGLKGVPFNFVIVDTLGKTKLSAIWSKFESGLVEWLKLINRIINLNRFLIIYCKCK